MQILNLRHQLYIHWRKIALLPIGIILFSSALFGQARFNPINNSGQDDKLISYGFFLAAHTNYWRMKYANRFLNANSTSLNQIQSIVPVYSPGFSLGFLVTIRLHDQFNLIFTPKIGFYEFKTEVNYFGIESDVENQISRSPEVIINEATMVEFPMIFKYKAQRFNNSRMFFTGGGSLMFRTKDQEEANVERIVTSGKDLTVDLGMGFDMYFKYFKFSPEIRFSHGLVNMYRRADTDPLLRDAITDLRRKSITLYLNFQ